MAIVAKTPTYCTNCEHKAVCKILENIESMDKEVDKFNLAHKSTLQSVSSINYNCRYKLKENVTV